MFGGDVGSSSRLKRPGMAWNKLIQAVGLDGVESWIASMMLVYAWPVCDGLGSACDKTFNSGVGTDDVLRLKTILSLVYSLMCTWIETDELLVQPLQAKNALQ